MDFIRRFTATFGVLLFAACATYSPEKNAASRFTSQFTVGHDAVTVRPDFDWRESQFKSLDVPARSQIMEKFAVHEATEYCRSESKIFVPKTAGPLIPGTIDPSVELLPSGFELGFQCKSTKP